MHSIPEAAHVRCSDLRRVCYVEDNCSISVFGQIRTRSISASRSTHVSFTHAYDASPVPYPKPTPFIMAAMQVDKLDVDSYLATAASSAPSDLHPFFEKFRKLHDRKCVSRSLTSATLPELKICWLLDYGTN